MKQLIAAVLFAASSFVQAVPDALRQGGASWTQWGSGEMTWFGFSLYRATLWVAARSSADLPADLPADVPTALQLDYRRDIPRDRLVQSSLDEMRRLGASDTQLLRWRSELRRVFPDVKEGESIVGVHYPGRGASFYYGGRPSGEIDDADFARLFFAIWLDPRSSPPGLRAALLERPAL